MKDISDWCPLLIRPYFQKLPLFFVNIIHGSSILSAWFQRHSILWIYRRSQGIQIGELKNHHLNLKVRGMMTARSVPFDADTQQFVSSHMIARSRQPWNYWRED
jgi:hypothetical protein